MKNIFIPSSQTGLNLALTIHEPLNTPKGIDILCQGYLDSKDYLHLVILAENLRKNGFFGCPF